MRPLWKDIITAIFMGMVLPGVMLNGSVLYLDWNAPPEETKPTIAVEVQTISMPVRVRSQEGTVEEEDMDAYLVEAVLAEMPASFEPEALKAQAVAARTYAWKAYQTGGKHGDGSVCTVPGCCQAHITQSAYLAQGGTQEGIEKVRNAVLHTAGECLTFEGELIEATYFASSGGSTEDAVAVWGAEYPYLQSVSSPGEEDSGETVSFTAEEIQARLGIVLPEEPGTWLGTITFTKGGGVDTMYLAGNPFSGKQLRELLGLRSTAFTAAVQDGVLVIQTRGHGHRVGMSQYGADAMAVQGASYREILLHYYPGTEIIRYADAVSSGEGVDSEF